MLAVAALSLSLQYPSEKIPLETLSFLTHLQGSSLFTHGSRGTQFYKVPMKLGLFFLKTQSLLSTSQCQLAQTLCLLT